MTLPRSRQEFKQTCLQRLGAPVIEINVSEEQVDDRVDYALKTWWNYHFDGSDQCYYKYVLQGKDVPNVVSEIEVSNSGIGYDNADIVVITADHGTGANASITTNANGSIVSVTVDTNGGGYYNPPTISVTSANGSGAVLTAYNGGYIPIPENIIGAVEIFDISSSLLGGSASMFNIQYQIALNDMYTISSASMVPYYMARLQIQSVGEMLIGKQPIRYNRHRNKMYLDMNWERTPPGTLIIVNAYQIVDPDVFTDAWNDRWLMLYGTAQIKQQWGNNLKKYSGLELPGKVTFNGQIIYDEATKEIADLEQRMLLDYGYPILDMIG